MSPRCGRLSAHVGPPPQGRPLRRAAPIFPILCATEARDSDHRWKPPHADGVRTSSTHDITRSDAGAVNLAATSGCIERIITAAKAGRRKAIVFVTGVPGAGKTLVGLNVATRHGERSDAAQRAWDARQLASFMKRKKGRPGFTQSESELLLSAMDRHDDWAVVVCLVGGGQEINTGEAGSKKWLESVRTAFPVSTSLRSFRAESLSRFVKALLDGAPPRPIDIRVNIDPVHWFLSPAKDTRSSLYLTPSITVFAGRSGRT